MGLKGFYGFIRQQCPDVMEQVHLSDFAYKRIAIDTSLYLYKFKYSRGNQWLSEFLNLVACLRKNEVHCVFVYDSGFPHEKDAERKRRRAERERMKADIQELEEALETYKTNGEISDLLAKCSEGAAPRRFLSPGAAVEIDVSGVEEKIEQKRKKIIEVFPADFTLTKQLFDILKVPWYDAPLEGETSCADLCNRGLVDGVLTDDSDVLAYHCPILLTKLQLPQGVCTQINHSKLLGALDVDRRTFLDLCIMSGTDYNPNVKRVGTKTAYSLLRQYKTIEGIAANTNHDVSVLKHERSRELFTDYTRLDTDKVPYCGFPDFEALQTFLSYHSNLDVNLYRRYFTRTIVLEDGPIISQVIVTDHAILHQEKIKQTIKVEEIEIEAEEAEEAEEEVEEAEEEVEEVEEVEYEEFEFEFEE